VLEAFPPYLPPAYRVKFADEAWEFEGARALRRQVFCEEQGLFPTDDTDQLDSYAVPIVAVSLIAGQPDEVVGAVRIHEEAPGVWWGSRLAVAQNFRRVAALGSGLIQVAVGSARAMGCREFHAHVQAQNRALFERLNWAAVHAIELHGHPHWRMRADLDAYPPIPAPTLGLPVRAKAA
jgi:putative N-acetyltransferase (TIGR04045 family)